MGNGLNDTENNRYVQKQFYISTWRAVDYCGEEEIYKKIIKANKEAGINLIENAILGRDDYLLSARICEEEGVDFLVSNITANHGFTGMGWEHFHLTEEDVRFVVDEVKDYKHLVGYYTWDENPHYNEDMTENLFTVCHENNALFHKIDPGRVAFSITNAGYGGDKWWEPEGTTPEESNYYKKVMAYLEQVDPDVIFFGHYPFFEPDSQIVEAWLWRDLGFHRRNTMRTGKPLGWYFQAIDQASGTVGHMTREKLSAQMFAGLAYSCKTLSYYMTQGALTDAFGNRTTLFEDIKSLNAEVQHLGDFLFDKTASEIYHFGLSEKQAYGYFLDDVTTSKVIETAPDNTIVSVFTDGADTKYVMVVNKDHLNGVTGELKLKCNYAIEEYNKGNDSFSILSNSINSVSVDINPGNCVLYQIKQMSC